MDPAVKNPDLKVQDLSLLSTIDESETEDASTTTTATDITEIHSGQTTTRAASIPKTSSAATPSESPAANVQAKAHAGQESSVPSLFSLAAMVIVTTGGARGIGLSMAQSLIECGATVHVLDRLPNPSPEFDRFATSLPTGTLTYHPIDVLDVPALNTLIARIADKHCGLDGLIAVAGIQYEAPALTYSAETCNHVLAVNITGVLSSAQAVARAMLAHGTP
ncbi:hypothetical protein V491_03886, partial [Pseudogymnoascus sp. VKM F-3775]